MIKYKKVTKLTAVGYEVKVYPSGVLHYAFNGRPHKTDGPAIIFSKSDHPDREDAWYIEGQIVDKEKVLHLNTCPLSELPLYLNTKYAPLVKERLKNANI